MHYSQLSKPILSLKYLPHFENTKSLIMYHTWYNCSNLCMSISYTIYLGEKSMGTTKYHNIFTTLFWVEVGPGVYYFLLFWLMVGWQLNLLWNVVKFCCDYRKNSSNQRWCLVVLYPNMKNPTKARMLLDVTNSGTTYIINKH